LELPGISARLRPRRSNVLRLTYRHKQPKDAWEYFSSAARRIGREPGDLWNQIGVTDEELGKPVLP
jgi:hypothetical protein